MNALSTQGYQNPHHSHRDNHLHPENHLFFAMLPPEVTDRLVVTNMAPFMPFRVILVIE